MPKENRRGRYGFQWEYTCQQCGVVIKADSPFPYKKERVRHGDIMADQDHDLLQWKCPICKNLNSLCKLPL